MNLAQTKNRQKGSVSIEFAVTILPFFVLLLALIEICRFMMVSSMIDVALASATRELVVNNSREDLISKLQLNLAEGKLPLLDGSKITVQAHYFENLKALADDVYVENFNGQDFAEFIFIYPYQALFIAGITDNFDRLANLKRTTLITLERSAGHAGKP